MTITKTAEGSKLTLALEGRLDTTTAPQLEAELKALAADVTEVVLDLAALAYISSAGLRVVLGFQKKMNVQGSMVITGAQPIIMEVFEVTGFTNVLTFA